MPAASSAPTPSTSTLMHGGFSIGVELPLDNDWSPVGEARRRQDGRRPGVPNLERHAELAQRVDALGFRALWVRDVPLYDPSFGDAAQGIVAFGGDTWASEVCPSPNGEAFPVNQYMLTQQAIYNRERVDSRAPVRDKAGECRFC